jgi:hypothetical protein
MECAEKAFLIAAFSIVTAAFSSAVEELASQTGICSVERYQELMRHADIMRLKSENARLQLENHTATHRC